MFDKREWNSSMRKAPRMRGFSIFVLFLLMAYSFLQPLYHKWVANQVCTANFPASRNSILCAFCAIANFEHSFNIATFFILDYRIELAKKFMQNSSAQCGFPEYLCAPLSFRD